MLFFEYSAIFYLSLICCSGYDFSDGEDYKNSKAFPFGFLDAKHASDLKRENELNALNDYRGSESFGLDYPYRDAFFEDDGNQFQDHRKKSDSRPKYDPGWKFIGLGKRPETEEELEYASELGDPKGAVNPLLGISTLINFEFFNAIRDGIEDVARETVKKEDSMSASSGISGENSGSLRLNNKLSWFNGRQKSNYDPGWMLTGLGK